MIYVMFFLFLYVCSFCEVNTSKMALKTKSAFYFASFCSFLLVAGCRYKTGYDFNAYMAYFEHVNTPSIFKRMETGYGWLNLFFKNTVNSYSIMLFCIVLFCTMLLFAFCKKYSPFPLMSLFVYSVFFFLSYNMGLMRQYIALSISLCTANALLDGKKIFAVLFILLAMLFHSSAIVTFLYFFCTKIKLNRPTYIAIVGTTVFLTFAGTLIVNSIVVSVFSFPFLPEALGKYIGYLSNAKFGQKLAFSSGLGYLTRVVLINFVFLTKENDTKNTNFFFNAVILGLLISAFGRNIAIIDRLAKYFSLFEIVFFVYAVQILKKRMTVFFPAISEKVLSISMM